MQEMEQRWEQKKQNARDVILRISKSFVDELKLQPPEVIDRATNKDTNPQENVLATLYVFGSREMQPQRFVNDEYTEGLPITYKNKDGITQPLEVKTKDGIILKAKYLEEIVDDSTAIVKVENADGSFSSVHVQRSDLVDAELKAEGDKLYAEKEKSEEGISDEKTNRLTLAQKEVVRTLRSCLSVEDFAEALQKEAVMVDFKKMEEVINTANDELDVEEKVILLISDFKSISDEKLREKLRNLSDADLRDPKKLKELFRATPEEQLELAKESEQKIHDLELRLRNLRIGMTLEEVPGFIIDSPQKLERAKQFLKDQVQHEQALLQEHKALAEKLTHKHEVEKVDKIFQDIASGSNPELIKLIKNALQSDEGLDAVIRVVFDEAKISLDPSKMREFLKKGGKYGGLAALLLLFASVYSASKQQRQ